MNFLNPLVLFGLIAASIPLILHLLNLRKLKIIEFSSLKFIKEMQKTKIRKLKLKQILLLILRTLIIIFIVLAFARPTVSTNLPLIGSYAKSDIVILIDNSFSMDVSDEFGNRWTQTKNLANDIIKNMIDGDQATIIPMTSTGILNNTLTSSKSSLKQELGKLSISNKISNLDNTIRYAYSLLGNSINLRKEINIITDGQQNIFQKKLDETKGYFLSNTSLFIVPVGIQSSSQINNTSVDSVNFITRIIQSGKPVEIKTFIHNHSNSDITGLVASLYMNGSRVAQRAVDITAGQTRDMVLTSETNSAGLIKGFVEIENDALDYDNTRYFSFSIPDKPKIAVFGNQSSILPLSIILNDNNGVSSNLSSYAASQIPSTDFSKFDIVVFADGPYRPQDFDKVRDFVKNGGSFLLFADNATTTEIFSKGISTLGFTGLNLVNVVGKPVQFDYTDKQHPIFDGVFKGKTDNKKIVESPQILRLMPPKSGQKIISTPAGQFLSESRVDKGKVFYVSINLSNEWSNFTRTGIFPVLIYRSIIYLTAKESVGQSYTIGEPVRYILPAKYSGDNNYKIVDPNNRESFYQSVSLPSGNILDLSNFDIPGIYTIYTSENMIAGHFALNKDPSESTIKKTNEKEIKESLKQLVNEKSEIDILDPNKLIKGINRAKSGSELWQFLIVLALLTALTEMFVARSIKNDNQ